MNDEIMTAEEAAEFLRVKNGRSVLKLVRKGILPSVKLNCRTLFLRSSLLETLKALETPTLDETEIEEKIRDLR